MEIKHGVELYLVSRLNAVDGELKFYTMNGGSDSDRDALAGKVDPPFGVVAITEAEEIITGANAYALTGAVVICTHMADTGTGKHAEWVRQTKAILDQINSECASASIAPTGFSIRLHGLDISKSYSADSPDDDAHADTLGFTAGATALPELTPVI